MASVNRYTGENPGVPKINTKMIKVAKVNKLIRSSKWLFKQQSQNGTVKVSSIYITIKVVCGLLLSLPSKLNKITFSLYKNKLIQIPQENLHATDVLHPSVYYIPLFIISIYVLVLFETETPIKSVLPIS